MQLKSKIICLIFLTSLFGLFSLYFSLYANAEQIVNPENISNTPFGSASNIKPNLEIDPQGNLHAVWMVSNNEGSTLHIYYSSKPLGGTWSQPEEISLPNEVAVYPSMAIENDGTVHVVIGSQVGDIAPIYYTNKIAGGNWSTLVNIRGNLGRNDTTSVGLAVDSLGTLHVTWNDISFTGRSNVAYTSKIKGGQWSSPENLTNTTTGAGHWGIFVGSDDTVFLPFNEVIANGSPESAFHLFTKQVGGSWIRTQIPDGIGAPSVAGSDGTLYAVYISSSQVYFSQKSPSGGWSTPVAPFINNSVVDIAPSISVDNTGVVYLLWHRSFNANSFPSNYNLFYAKRSIAGDWSVPQQLTSLSGSETMPHPGYGDSSSPIKLMNDRIHFLWQQGRMDNFLSWQIMYGFLFTQEPPVIDPITNATKNEGDTYSVGGSFTDSDSVSWTATVNYGDGSGTNPLTLSGTNFSLNHVYDDNGTYTVTVAVTDNQGAVGTKTATITVNNVNPSIDSVAATEAPTLVGTAINAQAAFSDPGFLDTHTAEWNWGDGTTSSGTVTEASGSGTVANSHNYAVRGVYTVTLTVTDKDNGTAEKKYYYLTKYTVAFRYFAGAVAFNSPAGAYPANPTATGEVRFGVETQRATLFGAPTGKAKMRFGVGNLEFASTNYTQMSILGARGQVRGTGEVNGTGGYTFILTVIDGQVPGGGGVDRVRIKIMNGSGTVVYDNQIGAPDNAAPTTPLTAGSILVNN